MATEVKAKKKCCGSTPRCKRCGVVLKRMAKEGLAERRSKRIYLVQHVPKKRMKGLRAR